MKTILKSRTLDAIILDICKRLITEQLKIQIL